MGQKGRNTSLRHHTGHYTFTNQYSFIRSRLVGLSRFELLTPRLSSVCSNQLSYRPTISTPLVQRAPGTRFSQNWIERKQQQSAVRPSDVPRSPLRARETCQTIHEKYQIDPRIFPRDIRPCGHPSCGSSRKEVIQPQVLLQLPCYDFTPITDHTLSACLPCGLAERFLVQPAFVM